MSDLTFENAIYSWGVFWIFYWISGVYLSWKGNNIRPVERAQEVVNCLALNMVWTFVGSIILFYIPIRLDTTFNIIIKLLLCNLVTEVWFYHVHLMLHHPQLYKKFHKRHHEFTHPYALTAMYCTGFEAVFCNLLAVGLGPVMLNITAPYLYIWFGLVAMNSTFTHSGFRLGWLMDGSHDIHHESYRYNYGTLTIFDRLYGTYKDPLQSSVADDTDDTATNEIKADEIKADEIKYKEIESNEIESNEITDTAEKLD